eukprot:1337219-Amorphochlora_amoeboformis.AAC.1
MYDSQKLKDNGEGVMINLEEWKKVRVRTRVTSREIVGGKICARRCSARESMYHEFVRNRETELKDQFLRQ